MEITCDYCYNIKLTSRHRTESSSLFCDYCGGKLSMKTRHSICTPAVRREQLILYPDHSVGQLKPPVDDPRRPHRTLAVRREKTTLNSDSSTGRSRPPVDDPPHSHRIPAVRRERTTLQTAGSTDRFKSPVHGFPPFPSPSPKPVLAREPTSLSKSRFCAYRDLCQEYVRSLHWPKEYFNSRYNRCYCSQCYPADYKDVLQTAGEMYVIPRDWVRVGLSVDEVRADRENLWKTWIVTYHGTKIPAARSILAHRQFLLPGDVCDDGTMLGIRPGHIPGKCQIYTSPTIKYSSLPMYCERYTYLASNGQRYKAKIVLQCRQQPGTYQIQGETIGSGSKPICDIIPNDRVEIFTTIRPAVVPYGLLIQLTPI